MDYEYFLEKCYGRYKYDWCKQRGYKPEDIDEEIGINGECYVCLKEFEQNEFQDRDYMKSLLSEYEFEWWETAVKKELPYKSDELFKFLCNEYIDNGYLYSGSFPYNSLIDKGFSRETINKLLDEGLIQKRNCDGLAYELSNLERFKLLSKHSLCSLWYEKVGNPLLEEIKNEVKTVSMVKSCIPSSKTYTVDTLKRQDDDTKPDKMDVFCPLEVGQVIQLEYDLPRPQKWKPIGYADATLSPGGVAVGTFIVTDIVHNLLVCPRENMIELQSLDHTFNQVHPDARTMLIFEDVVLKRLKEPSLNDKITAASRNGSINPNMISKNKEPEL